MATTTETRPTRPQRQAAPSTGTVVPPPPPPPPKPPPTRRPGGLGGALSLGSLLKVRRRPSEDGEVAVEGLEAVHGLVGAATEHIVHTHPGLFPLYRRLQIALAVLLGLGLCPPDRLLRIQATAMQARADVSPDRMQRAFTKALDTATRTPRHGRHQATYERHVQLYSDWWASAWFCGLRRVDVLADLLHDMRCHLRPLMPPQQRRTHALGAAMSYTFGAANDTPPDHPQTSYTVTGSRALAHGGAPVHATVHSSSPLQLEWARSSPRDVPLGRTKQAPRLAPDVFVPPDPSPASLPPSLPSPGDLPPSSPGLERAKEGRSMYESVRVLGRYKIAAILPGRRRKTSLSKDTIPETPPSDSGLSSVARGPRPGRQRSDSRENNATNLQANALTMPTGSRLAERRPSLPF